MAAVALQNRLNANLVRRWVVSEERAPREKPTDTAAPVATAAEQRTFIPIELEHSRVAAAQAITIELRRGATIVKVDWPLAASAECAGWLRELLR